MENKEFPELDTPDVTVEEAGTVDYFADILPDQPVADTPAQEAFAEEGPAEEVSLETPVA